MSLLVGVPVILPPRAEVTASWTHRPRMLYINGAHDEWFDWAARTEGTWWDSDPDSKNIGVAASWNRIFEAARNIGMTHVALMSQGVVLDGGTEHLATLVEKYADWRGLLTDFAWRVIVLAVAVWEQVGPFDEGFQYGYYEDSDYTRRLFLAGIHHPDNPMPKVGRDLLDGTATEAATMTARLIPREVYGENGQRFYDKWNGVPFQETYDRPYRPESLNPTNNWSYYDRQPEEPARGRPQDA